MTTNSGYIFSVQETSDNSYILAGESSYPTRGLYLAKVDTNGNLLWDNVTLLGTTSIADRAYCVQETSDNGYIAAGYTRGRTFSSYDDTYDIYVVKFDSLGKVEWQKVFGGDSSDEAHFIQQTNDGGYILTGFTYSNTIGGLDVFLLKLDSSGNSLWYKKMGTMRDDVGNCVRQTLDGGYIITGRSIYYDPYTPVSRQCAYVVKTDADGNVQWDKMTGGTEAFNVRQINEYYYEIMGEYLYDDGRTREVYVAKMDMNGNMLWEKRIQNPIYDLGVSRFYVDLSNDGGFIATGTAHPYGFDIYVEKIKTIYPVLPLPVVGFFDPVNTVKESDGSISINVWLVDEYGNRIPAPETITVDYTISSGTANAGTDYTGISGTLTFNSGDRTQQITIPIVDDQAYEKDETFTVVLSTPSSNSKLSDQASVVTTIEDNDPLPTVQLNTTSYVVDENAAYAIVTVTVNGLAEDQITINYIASDGMAKTGSDFNTVSGTITFNSGETEKTISVPVIDDDRYEGNEAFIISLNSPINGILITPYLATVTVVDDEPIPVVEFSSPTYTVNEIDGLVTLYVTINAVTHDPITVSYSTNDDSAISGSDYMSASGTLTFADGETTKLLTISIIGDKIGEKEEAFNVLLTSPSVHAILGSKASTSVKILERVRKK